MSDIQRLDDLAATLKEAALRVLLKLRALTTDQGDDTITVSTTELATRCKLAQSAVRRALAELTGRTLITMRAATSTRPTIIRVNAFATVQLQRTGPTQGVPLRGTPPGASKEHTPCLFEAPPVPFRGAPPTENADLTATARRVDEVPMLTPILDRVLRSKVTDHDPETLAYFRRYLHGFMCKLGRDDRNQPTPHAHPPDAAIVAQLLAVADPHHIHAMLDNLLMERHDCHSYGWFVTVALQRIHSISFTQQKKARAELRAVKAGGRATADTDWQQQTLQGIGAIAQQKAIR